MIKMNSTRLQIILGTVILYVTVVLVYGCTNMLPVNQRPKKSVHILDKRKWPNKTVPYKMDPTFTLKKKLMILSAMEVISNESCVNFRPAVPEDRSYAYVSGHQPNCFSEVGYTNGVHSINYGKNCFRSKGIILHELLHLLGFFHQHSDPQRDKYVKINYENIIPADIVNFEKLEEGMVGNYGVPYDYNSIMHYSATAHSINGRMTIEPLDPSAKIGQRVGLSEGDILKLNRMYNCP